MNNDISLHNDIFSSYSKSLSACDEGEGDLVLFEHDFNGILYVDEVEDLLRDRQQY